MRLRPLCLMAALLPLAACDYRYQGEPLARQVMVAEPAYIVTVGVRYEDVLGMLGQPAAGPFFDRYAKAWSVVYEYPVPAIETEIEVPGGSVRTEMVKQIRLFYDLQGIVIKLVSHPDRYYPFLTNTPVRRFMVVPRVVKKVIPVALPPAAR